MFRFVSLITLAGGCQDDVAKDKAVATVVEPTRAPASTPAAVVDATPGDAWTIDPARSSVKAHAAKITRQHDIFFPQFTGTAKVADGKVRSVAFDVSIDSLETDAPKLITHLKSEDFFNVPAFPKATFQSSSIVEGAAAPWTHTVTGDLTMHGVTKTVTFPAKIEATPSAITASSEFAINRQDWGVAYHGKPDDLIQDNVLLSIAFTAVPNPPSGG